MSILALVPGHYAFLAPMPTIMVITSINLKCQGVGSSQATENPPPSRYITQNFKLLFSYQAQWALYPTCSQSFVRQKGDTALSPSTDALQWWVPKRNFSDCVSSPFVHFVHCFHDVRTHKLVIFLKISTYLFFHTFHFRSHLGSRRFGRPRHATFHSTTGLRDQGASDHRHWNLSPFDCYSVRFAFCGWLGGREHHHGHFHPMEVLRITCSCISST